MLEFGSGKGVKKLLHGNVRNNARINSKRDVATDFDQHILSSSASEDEAFEHSKLRKKVRQSDPAGDTTDYFSVYTGASWRIRCRILR